MSAIENGWQDVDGRYDFHWFEENQFPTFGKDVIIQLTKNGACLMPFTNGMLFTWTSPFMLKIINNKEYYDITEKEVSYLPIISPIAMAVSSPLTSNLNDIIGRKSTLLCMAVPYILAWIISAIAKDLWMFYLFRVVSGIGDGCIFSSLPMYVGEISTPKVRGTWGNAMSISVLLGQLLISIIGGYYTIQQAAYICICIPVLFLVLFSFMPESPYFYIMKDEHEKAKESLRKLRRKSNVETEFQLLKAAVERQISESGTWADLYIVKSNRKAVLAGIFLRTSQQFAGMSVFFSYSGYIFEKLGGSINVEVSSIIYFGVQCCLSVLAGLSIDSLGRKKMYIESLLGCGFVLLAEAVFFILDTKISIDVTHFKWIPLAGMILCAICFGWGINIVPILMMSELFSANVKVKGLMFLTIFYGLFISITSQIFYLLTTYFGLYAPFLLFSISCLVSAVLTHFVVPETKGKTLEEIQLKLKKNYQREPNFVNDVTKC